MCVKSVGSHQQFFRLKPWKLGQESLFWVVKFILRKKKSTIIFQLYWLIRNIKILKEKYLINNFIKTCKMVKKKNEKIIVLTRDTQIFLWARKWLGMTVYIEMSETLESLTCVSQHLYLSITLKITLVVLLNTSMMLMDCPTVFQLFSVKTGGRGHSMIPLPTSSVVTHEWVSVRRNLVWSLFLEKKKTKTKTKQKWMITKCRNESCYF